MTFAHVQYSTVLRGLADPEPQGAESFWQRRGRDVMRFRLRSGIILVFNMDKDI
jgi:hypothetical protein